VAGETHPGGGAVTARERAAHLWRLWRAIDTDEVDRPLAALAPELHAELARYDGADVLAIRVPGKGRWRYEGIRQARLAGVEWRRVLAYGVRFPPGRLP
jgi:hypothetical protein